jgi:membrane-associated phospholipid phosphatase
VQIRKPSSLVCTSLTCVCLLGVTAPAGAQTVASSNVPREDPAVVASAPSNDAPSGHFSNNAFNDLFGKTLDDFRRLPSKDTLTWLSIGAAVATVGHSVDRPVSRRLSTSPLLDGVFESGATVGGARLQLAGALTTYTIGRITNSPKVALVGGDLLRAQIIAQALTAGVKMSARRTRPDGTQYSFPSGHTSVTFASATVLQRDLGWKAGVPAYAVATYVAASRIQEKRHFLSDVAFGAAIGIIAGRTVTIGHGERQFAVTPMAVASGGGVSFTWLGQR